MKKFCFVIHNRANFARIQTVITALQESTNVEVQVIFASSSMLHNFGKIDEYFRPRVQDKVERIHNIVAGDRPVSMAKTTGLATIELAQSFERLEPDVVVTVADRHETLATAIAASYMNIPLAHTQGGEVSGSIDESVRHACTKLSHLHFPATENAREVIIQLGEDPDMVFNFGCPAMDIAELAPLRNANDVIRDYRGVGPELDLSSKFILVSHHAVTTHHESAIVDNDTILAAITELDLPTVWLWPNIDSGSENISKSIRRAREMSKNLPIKFYTNLSAIDYASLMKSTSCIVGNSSSGIRESAFLGVPSVNIGDRQKGRERSENVIDVEYDKNQILSAVKSQISKKKFPRDFRYGVGKAGEKIAAVLKGTSIDTSKQFRKVML